MEFNGVSLHFADKPIFVDINLTGGPGECLGLLGLSGVGKSTLLRLLLETLHPWRGSIYFDGTEITHLSRERLNKIRTRIGIVFESSALISSWSVSENLALALRDLVFTITTQAVSVRHVIGYVPQAISVDGALIRVRKRNHLHSA